jgi:cysteine-rich repeat protein
VKWWLTAALAAALGAGAALVSCGGDNYTPTCGNGVLDPGEECDDGNKWNNDGCSSVCTLEIAHTTLNANIGINRNVVPGYEGDACSTLGKTLVIDGSSTDGYQLQHQELDCAMGYNGWPFYDVPGGHYVITMALYDKDGNALTDPKDGEGDVVAGQSATIYVDFDYADFKTSFTGNLRWQYDWSAAGPGDGGVADGGIPDAGTLTGGVPCSQATPAVSKVRITLHNDQGQVVSDQTTFGTPTNGSQRVACHDFGASDAEVVTSLPWGIYSITLEGLDTGNSTSFCAERALFVTKGDGVIFHLTGQAGTCQ